MGSKLRTNKLVVWCASRIKGASKVRNFVNNQSAQIRSWQGTCMRKLPLTSVAFGPPRRYAATAREWILPRLADPAGHQFHDLFPAARTHRPLPPNACPKFTQRFAHLQEPELLPAFVAHIRGGRFVGRLFGSVIAPDDSLLFDLSIPQINRGLLKHELFGAVKLPRVRRLEGPVAVLSTPEADLNFSHWLCDLMARVHWLKLAGYELRNCSHVILRHTNLPFQLETLKKLAISDTQLMLHTDLMHIEAETLIVPSYLNWGFNCDKESYRLAGLQGVRDFYLSSNPHVGADGNYPRRIYLSRQHAKVRRVLNGEALESCLRQFGFATIAMEQLTVAEQAALFSQAEVVVGPHGAGFTNVIFCKPGTRILEMFHPDFISPNFWDCSTSLGLDYQPLVTSDPSIGSTFFKFRQAANMTVDLAVLRNIFKRWGL